MRFNILVFGLRRLWGLVVVLALFCAPTAESAQTYEAAVRLQSGYRVDNLDWNIAGTSAGTNPNILSELTWEDVESYYIQISGRVSVGEEDRQVRSLLRLEAGYGWIFSGKNQDSDFFGDNRTNEFLRSNNQADGGDVADVSLGIGPQVLNHSGLIRLTPLVGYSYHEQDLVITDGVQTIPAPAVPFLGLNSDYEATWLGPWVGYDLEVRSSDSFSFLGGFEWHFAEYQAEAKWNLRDQDVVLPDGTVVLPALAQPKSFEHEATGYGLVLRGEGEYALNKHWRVVLSARYQRWWIDDGVDRVFIDSPELGTFTSETRLNEVNWESFSGAVGVAYRF